MMRSLFSGVSGLRVHQTRMDIIGHNISNVNTVGYKAQRMTFADAMAQRMAPALAQNDEMGRAGRNPMQVGLGVNIGGIDSIMTQGAAQRTDRPFDLTIQGEGFFMVEDANGMFFTRAGNIDWNGNVFSIGGMPLLGFPAVEDSSNPGSFVIDNNILDTLITPEEIRRMSPVATTQVDVRGNLNANDIGADGYVIRRMEFYDSIGNRYAVDFRMRWHPPLSHPDVPPGGVGGIYSTNEVSQWSFDLLPGTAVAGQPGTALVHMFRAGDRTNTPIPVHMSMNIAEDNMREGGTIGEPTMSGRIGFSPYDGSIRSFTVGTGAGDLYRRELALIIDVPALEPPSIVGEDPQVNQIPTFNSGFIRLNMDALRQHSGVGTSLRTDFADGNPPGDLQDVSVGRDGIIMARYTNGEMRPIGQIPLAQFLNPEGLERVGNNLWIPSANSGDWDVIYGDFIAGSLEMSNVELSNEFTEMITTQRGFQANSRVITTSDEILQELVNLKR